MVKNRKFVVEKTTKDSANAFTTSGEESTATEANNSGNESAGRKRTRSQGRHSNSNSPNKKLSKANADTRDVRQVERKEQTPSKNTKTKSSLKTPPASGKRLKSVIIDGKAKSKVGGKSPKSPKVDKSDIESEDGELDSESDSDTNTEKNLTSDEGSEISLTIDLNKDDTIDSDSAESRASKRRSRSPKRSEKKRRRNSKKSKSRSRSRSRSHHRDREERRERKRRKEKRAKSRDLSNSEDEDEQVLRIVKLVREQMKRGNSSRGQSSETPRKLTPVKSPSASTIYTPAIKRNEIPRRLAMSEGTKPVNEITNFLKTMRLIADTKSPATSATRTDLDRTLEDGARNQRSGQEGGEEAQRSTRQIADDLIIQAEKNKAMMLPKTGNDEEVLDRVDPNNMNHLLDDCSFLHITCHIDKNLRAKIQRGEYVDLAKLLQKPKHMKSASENEEKALVNRGGEAKFINLEDNIKVNSVRKWEQAFRIYATIYSQANPHRSAEIFQYINTINDAAKSFTWECVGYYDYTFRHLMERKPNRSWAKTFPELWNMSMVEPVSRNNNNGNNGRKRDWRDNCCWRYNKSICKYGKDCKFDHRCTYCGGSHPASRCFKKGSSSRRSESRGESSSGEHRESRDEHSKHHHQNKKAKRTSENDQHE